MEAQFDHSRIITQSLPTLLHLASVKVGLLLMKRFDYATLMKANKRIQEGALIDSDEIRKDPNFFENKVTLIKCKLDLLECQSELLNRRKISAQRKKKLKWRILALEESTSSLKRNMVEYYKTDPLIKQYMAQQILKHEIPLRLRLRVIEAVQGMEFGVRQWKSYHLRILELKDRECVFCWKSDGTIDRTKTALQLVLNENIHIRKRFLLACTYCFEEIIHSLWLEMKASNKTEYFKTFDNTMVHFWVRRMLCASPIHWRKDFCDYIYRYPQILSHFISFFPLLQPQDRNVLLPYLESTKLDIFRRCLHVMTDEEEEWLLQSCPSKLLCSFLQWPMRSMFLETVNKMWNYIDKFDFLFVLKRLFLIKKCEEFDISELFQGFWERSPRHFRKFAWNYPGMRKEIKSWLDEVKTNK